MENSSGISSQIRLCCTLICITFKSHLEWNNTEHVCVPTTMILPITAGTYEGLNQFGHMMYVLTEGYIRLSNHKRSEAMHNMSTSPQPWYYKSQQVLTKARITFAIWCMCLQKATSGLQMTQRVKQRIASLSYHYHDTTAGTYGGMNNFGYMMYEAHK